MKTILLSLLLHLSVISANAQEKQGASLWSNEEVKQLNAELYKDCPQYQTSELIKLDIAFCARFEIVEITGNEIPPSELFSSLVLKNKCNPSFQHQGTNFNAKTFNPLHYFFMLKNNQTKWYRVDNTNYFIKINATK
jgi:hypothetical protein